MADDVAAELVQKKCQPCEGGVPPLGAEEAKRLRAGVPDWEIDEQGKSIRRRWRVEDFMTAIDFFGRIAEIAEVEDHHPDLHLTGYRNVEVALSTHAIGGLSENDFIVAAKIDRLPLRLKAKK